MNKKEKAYLYILITPFVVGAAFEFLPLWVAWPIALLGAMTYFGSCALLAQEK